MIKEKLYTCLLKRSKQLVTAQRFMQIMRDNAQPLRQAISLMWRTTEKAISTDPQVTLLNSTRFEDLIISLSCMLRRIYFTQCGQQLIKLAWTPPGS